MSRLIESGPRDDDAAAFAEIVAMQDKIQELEETVRKLRYALAEIADITRKTKEATDGAP